jgi:hypothetical protein
MRYTPEHINTLNANEIFVFGSNLAGIHGAGAARLAFGRFGAVWGVGIGHQGRSYALPTKDKDIETLSLPEINNHVIDFLEYARNNPQFTFLVTKVGCGLAGWTVEDIAPCFGGETPANVVLPREFYK